MATERVEWSVEVVAQVFRAIEIGVVLGNDLKIQISPVARKP